MHYLRPSDSTTSPGEEWWCGPRGTHHHFKTHQRLGTKEALAGSVSHYTEGKHVLDISAVREDSLKVRNPRTLSRRNLLWLHLMRRCLTDVDVLMTHELDVCL